MKSVNNLTIKKELMYNCEYGYILSLKNHTDIVGIHYIANDILKTTIESFYEQCRLKYKCYRDFYKFYFYKEKDALEVLDWIISVATLNALQ